MDNSPIEEAIESFISTMKNKWKWFIGLGIVLIICAIIALSYQFFATIFSIYFLSTLIIIAGIFQIIHAFQIKNVSQIFFWGGAGLLYTLTGIIAYCNPVLASSVLTLLMGCSLIVTGIIQGINAYKLYRYYHGSGWLILSAVLSFLLGLIIVIGWPLNSIWLIGLFLGIDLLFRGWGYIAIGLSLKP